MMSSPDPIPTTLSDQLQQLGLVHTASELNDFIARATQKRWSPVVQLEHLVQAELEARLRHRVERRLRDARLGRFKPMADWEWGWPKAIHRPTVDRVLTLDFLAQRENVIVVAPHGLGKTMIAKNLVHEAILAGHSARFLTAADLILDLTRQETARALQHRLRSYLRPSLLAIDEVGYLAYDAHAADLLFQVVSRRYEQKSIVITTNRLCGAPHKRFNAEPIVMRSLRRRGPARASRGPGGAPHYGAGCQGGDQLVSGFEAA
jgi:DNA replication protein DnaC